MSILYSIFTLVLFMQAAPPEPPKFAAKMSAARESVAPGGQVELLIEIEIGSPWQNGRSGISGAFGQDRPADDAHGQSRS